MRRYSISIETEDGQGDYGSNFLTVVNNQPRTKRSAIEAANRIARERSTRALVFVGKSVGRLIYDSKESK